jgi:hypothetical protein
MTANAYFEFLGFHIPAGFRSRDMEGMVGDANVGTCETKSDHQR